MSAVLENWADGVDHWGVLWAIRSLSHVDHNGVGVTIPSFFSATDIKPFLLESPHGHERREQLLAVARTMERSQSP
jgi:hypothetical protein